MTALASHIATVTTERDQLAQWKAEALPVIAGLQDLGKALGLPLGTQVTGPAAVEAVKALTAERDQARATNTRLNARLTRAEAAMETTIDDCKRAGTSLGRMLANAAATKYETERDQARAELDALKADRSCCADTADHIAALISDQFLSRHTRIFPPEDEQIVRNTALLTTAVAQLHAKQLRTGDTT